MNDDEEDPLYIEHPGDLFTFVRPVHKNDVVALARILLSEGVKEKPVFTNPSDVREYFSHEIGKEEREIFGCLFLDNQHRFICFEKLFFGTIDGANVYPREVVKRALSVNAAAVIFTHNHPSGMVEPSQADRRITERLVAGLALVDIRVLDHIIVGDGDTTSFAERGLL